MSPWLEISKGAQRDLSLKRRPPDPEGRRVVRLVDLFSGCGRFSLGILEACRSLGFRREIALAVEVEPAITQICETNFTPTAWKGSSRVNDWEFARTITPHEAPRLQFFPDWFSFRDAPFRSALSDAIGNAVPVKLGFVAGVAVLSSLAQVRRKSAGSSTRGVW